MYRLLILFLFAVAGHCAYGQTDSLTKEERRLLDSMFSNDEFINLMMKKKESYVDVGIGIGNSIFSLKNNALNAEQAQTNTLYYKPTVAYNHKSGVGFSVSSFLAMAGGALKVYQYSLSPSYLYNNKKFSAGISYTRFIEGSDAGFYTSPFKNDFYASMVYKKTWIRPGITLGYSFGKLTDHFDSSFWLLNRIVHIRDTATTRINGLTLNVTASHQWYFEKLIAKKDAIELQPMFMLNAGSQKWKTTHTNRLINRFPRVNNYFKRVYCDSCASEHFRIQSLAFSAQATYYYNRFYIQPQLYLDYYLPATTQKRLTSLFSVTAGFLFY